MKEVLGPIPMEGRLHSFTTRLCHGLRRKRQWKESTLATTLLCSYVPDYLRILIQPD